MIEKRFRFTKSAVDALEHPTEAEVGTVGYRIVWDTQVINTLICAEQAKSRRTSKIFPVLIQ